VARKLMGMGYDKVYALLGGWDAWKQAGFPVEAK
jgi:rhodanese-related sulfurtransferase